MKAELFKEMGHDELEHKLEELKRKLFESKSQSVTEKVENVKMMRNMRRDIARVKTVMRQKQQ